jgi:recombination protein RecA
MGDAQMGLQARLMSQAMRKLTAIIGKSRTLLIFINQIRMKIGVMFGNPETTTGGNALKFYSSLRLDVRKHETIDGAAGADAIGNRVKIKVVKNKVAPPFRKVDIDIIYGKGVSAAGSLLDAAVKYDVVDKKGAWFAYNEEKIGQGRDNAREYLEQNPAMASEIETKLRGIMFPGRDLPAYIKVDAAPSADTPAGKKAAKASKADAAAATAEEAVVPAPAPEPPAPPVKAPAAEPREPPVPPVKAAAAPSVSVDGLPAQPKGAGLAAKAAALTDDDIDEGLF